MAMASQYVTQYGAGTTISSPGFISAISVMKTLCFAPLATTICEASYSIPKSAFSLSATAFLSSGSPAAGVYFVYPALMAATPASLICAGVGKSGSPVPKLTTSSPAAFIFFARLSTASVEEACTAEADLDSSFINHTPGQLILFIGYGLCIGSAHTFQTVSFLCYKPLPKDNLRTLYPQSCKYARGIFNILPFLKFFLR